MDNCKHVIKMKPARDHSVLNPQKWHCMVCDTTESVWACLSCPYVACGRYIAEHALKHYQDSKHPLTMEVNEKYVYCYECDDYILNDNAAGDIKILRNCLQAITTQSFTGMSRTHHRMLRSHSYTGLGSWQCQQKLHSEDLSYTALLFRRYYMLAKAFCTWKKLTPSLLKNVKVKKSEKARHLPTRKSSRKNYQVIAGVTGLRNLGNTCYMNSILQVLSNLQAFREHFIHLQTLCSQGGSTTADLSPDEKRTLIAPRLQRQTTMECFQHVNDILNQKGGLNGGSSQTLSKRRAHLLANSKSSGNLSLIQELHTLLRVMWSGKWALVSPQKMLQTVWSVIPFFKGYTQQDAQEFLCEFLNKVQCELDNMSGVSNGPHSVQSMQPLGGATGSTYTRDVVDNLFQGELVSEVKCLRCGHMTQTHEPFMDISLDFPDRYHWHKNEYKVCVDSCHVRELLSHFTKLEKLDGKIYACSKCNRRRRSVSNKPTIYTEAEKRFLIKKLPHVLRLHLKRFTWAGRNHRGKIPVHVDFDEELNLSQFQVPDLDNANSSYRLAAVVIHHGRGFGSGHYTCYCWNTESASWVHCNDAKMELCHWDDVHKAQAYILIYVRKDFSYTPNPNLLLSLEMQQSMYNKETAAEELTQDIDSSIPKFIELKRRLSEDWRGRYQLKRRKSSIW